MRPSILSLTGLLAAALASACASRASEPAATPATVPGSTSQVTLLGTGGGPIARIGRSQPANLLRIGGKAYLIDIGDGTARQLVRSGLRLNAVDAVFLTHLHFDHTAGLMGFLALDWQDRRSKPVDFYGPPGTARLVADTLAALGSGEAIFRPQLPDLPAMASVFRGHDWDVTGAREVYRDEAVAIRAVENSHYGTMHLAITDHGVDRSYSYRFDAADRSIVFTGDTGPSAAVEQLARGADVLVSEVIDIDAMTVSLRRRQQATGIDQQPLIDHMTKEHLTAENAGRMAAAAGVRTLVLTHFATPPGSEAIDQAAMLAAIRRHYQGKVIFGEDLTAI